MAEQSTTNYVSTSFNSQNHLCKICKDPISFIVSADCQCKMKRICHKCAIRFRLENQFHCPSCIHLSSSITIGKINDLPIYFDKTIYVTDDLSLAEVRKQIHYYCPERDCNELYQSAGMLANHFKAANHKMRLCGVCITRKTVLASELEFYTEDKLKIHETQENMVKGKMVFHVKCPLCPLILLDEEDFFYHLDSQQAHFNCQFCNLKHHYWSNRIYYLKHLSTNHFVCNFTKCMEQEKYVSFVSVKDLNDHKQKYHRLELRDPDNWVDIKKELEDEIIPKNNSGEDLSKIKLIYWKSLAERMFFLGGDSWIQRFSVLPFLFWGKDNWGQKLRWRNRMRLESVIIPNPRMKIDEFKDALIGMSEKDTYKEPKELVDSLLSFIFNWMTDQAVESDIKNFLKTLVVRLDSINALNVAWQSIKFILDFNTKKRIYLWVADMIENLRPETADKKVYAIYNSYEKVFTRLRTEVSNVIRSKIQRINFSDKRAIDPFEIFTRENMMKIYEEIEQTKILKAFSGTSVSFFKSVKYDAPHTLFFVNADELYQTLNIHSMEYLCWLFLYFHLMQKRITSTKFFLDSDQDFEDIYQVFNHDKIICKLLRKINGILEDRVTAKSIEQSKKANDAKIEPVKKKKKVVDSNKWSDDEEYVPKRKVSEEKEENDDDLLEIKMINLNQENFIDDDEVEILKDIIDNSTKK